MKAKKKKERKKERERKKKKRKRKEIKEKGVKKELNLDRKLWDYVTPIIMS